MFDAVFSNSMNDSNAQEKSSRRQFTRRRCDRVVGQINGHTFPVDDWSLGGTLLFADSKQFRLKDKIKVNMKFNLRDRIHDVPHSGTIVRKTKNHIAIEFDPLNQNTREGFQAVVDDHFDQIMANSPWKKSD